MMHMLRVAALLLCPLFIKAQDISISVKNNDESETQAKKQLERIIKTYDIQKWIFTKKIVIDKNEYIPFSHPVLTLNTRYLDDDVKQLATFLHEEFHWFENANPTKVEAAIADFKRIFPQTPDRNNGGAKNEYSNYLHLIVCDLEFQALTKLLGEAKARLILEQWKHYRWVYTKVLSNPAIRETNMKYGLIAP